MLCASHHCSIFNGSLNMAAFVEHERPNKRTETVLL